MDFARYIDFAPRMQVRDEAGVIDTEPTHSRPHLPPLLICALSFWASSALSYMCLCGHESIICINVFFVCVACAIAALVLFLRLRYGVFLFACVMGLVLGVAISSAGATSLAANIESVSALSAGAWRFELLEDVQSSAYGKTCLARVYDDENNSIVVRLTLDEEVPVSLYGDSFRAYAKLSVASDTLRETCWKKGAAATCSVSAGAYRERVSRTDIYAPLLKLRCQVLEVLTQVNDDGARALLQALLCGARVELNELALYSDYKSDGLAHMVAVSGAHLVIVSSFLALLLRSLRVPRSLSVVLQIGFVLVYLILAAAPISGIRAAVMSIVGMTSYASRRRSAPLNGLALCIMTLIALAPYTAVSVSFALSAASTLGIMLLSGLFGSWFESLPFALPRFVREALSLTFSANVVTMPASAALFAQVSLIAPLANVVCTLPFTLICAGGLLAALLSVIFPFAAGVLMGICECAAGLLNACVSLLASIPFAAIPFDAPLFLMIVFSVVLCAVLWWFYPRFCFRKFLKIGGCLVCTSLAWVVISANIFGTEIIMLDVGQGDAFLLHSQGCTVLIDTGNRDTLLRQALARHGVYKLDALIITHADDDHCASMSALDGVVDVDAIYLAKDALSCTCDACSGLRNDAAALVGKEKVCGLAQGDEIRFGLFDLHVVWPSYYSDAGGNADSLCLLASYCENQCLEGESRWTAFFCGDAEADQINAMYESGVLGEVDIYKVGHHGSAKALDARAASNLSPSIALISVGENNRYGHPSEETLERLETEGARIFRSDTQGDVSCKLTSDAITVTTLR